MAGEIQDLTNTAAAHPRYPEGQSPSSLNDGARAVEGIIQRWFNDTNYSVQATVSGSVIQMTANRVSITLTGTTSNYMADLLMAFTMGSVASPDGCYININGIGAISLRSNDGTSLSASALHSGARVLAIKDNANNYFRLLHSTGLNYYEEGPWTPVLQGSAGGAMTHVAQEGYYTRIGRQVTVTFSVQVSSLGTASGTLQVAGLPFPVGTETASGSRGSGALTSATGLTHATGCTAWSCRASSGGTSVIAIRENGSGVADSQQQITNTAAATTLVGMMTYFV